MACEVQVRVFSQNCWLIPVMASWPFVDMSLSERCERLISLLKTVEDSADIVLLQELWSPRAHVPVPSRWFARRQVEECLRWKFPSVSEISGAGNFNLLKTFDSGLLIASKLPLVCSEFRLFRACSNREDALASKGVLAQAFAIGNLSEIVVATTHLDAVDDVVKFAQLDELLEFLAEFARPRKPGNLKIILTGDFNLDTKKHPRLQQRMQQAGFLDAFEKFPIATAQEGQRLDYIWVKGASVAEISDQQVVSDNFWRAKTEDLRRLHCATDHGGLSLTLKI